MARTSLLLSLLLSVVSSSHSWTSVASKGRRKHNSNTIGNNRLSPLFDSSIAPTAAATTTTHSEPILGPSTCASDPAITFDVGCVANPVILPPKTKGEKWLLFYYGNAGSWHGGVDCFLPTGSCGLAESDDGITWEKVEGPLEGGAILAPTGNDEDFDGIHLGVGDVVRGAATVSGTDELYMYYFGGSSENVMRVGIRMRIGKAKSLDGGRSWERLGMVLDYDESEGLFASWPRIIQPPPDKSSQPWKMYYHSFDGKQWRVFGASSVDGGDTWKRTGLEIQGGKDEDSFDSMGIGTRAIIPWRDGLLMVYEGVSSADGTHRFGAAYNNDRGGSGGSGEAEWKKLHGGLPILEPGKAPLGEWASQVIGTPYLVSMPDGRGLRLYHCAKNGPDAKMQIGVLVSESGDIEPESWRPACYKY
jgi:hypothetical protein